MKNILITGANSYIGVSFQQYMLRYKDAYIIDTVDTIDGKWRRVDFQKYDVVFHVAGIAHIKETKNNEDMYYKVNRDLTFEIAKEAKKNGVKQFIFLSSMSVYGLTSGIITKDIIPNPKSNYGKSKLQAEELILELQDEKFIISILRPPMIYGKDCKGNYQTLSKFAKRLPIFPDIKNKRSMLYIDNLSIFLKKIIDTPENKVFYPQNNEYVCTSNMVKMISNENKKNIILTKAFNWIVKILMPLDILKKIFGNLIYEQTDVIDEIKLAESIMLTEHSLK